MRCMLQPDAVAAMADIAGNVPSPSSHHAGARTLGLVLIFSTAIIWIATSFISESLVQATGGHEPQVPPLLLTYLATTLFTLYIPTLVLKQWVGECLLKRGKRSRHGLDVEAKAVQATSFGSLGHVQQPAVDVLNDKMARTAAFWSTPLWFGAQYTFNLSLAYTSVTSNTILSSSSSLFTYGLSIFLLGEKYTLFKLLCILACMGGTALVTLSDTSSSSGTNLPLVGDVLVVVSAALYAAYTVTMRKTMPSEDAEAHVGAFFGYVGLFTTVLLAPVIVIMLATGAFSLSAIPQHVYWIILLEGLLDYVLSDYLWARGVMLLGPTVATLGLSIQIPMAAGADLIFGHPAWIQSGQSIVINLLGTTLIMVGFFGVNWGSGTSSQDGPGSGRVKARLSDNFEAPAALWRGRVSVDGVSVDGIQASEDESRALLAGISHAEDSSTVRGTR